MGLREGGWRKGKARKRGKVGQGRHEGMVGTGWELTWWGSLHYFVGEGKGSTSL